MTFDPGRPGNEWDWVKGEGITAIAVVDEKAQANIRAVQEELMKAVGDPKYLQLTPPEKLHVTIATIKKNTLNIGTAADPEEAKTRAEILKNIKAYVQSKVNRGNKDSSGEFKYKISDISLMNDGGIVLICEPSSVVLNDMITGIPGLFLDRGEPSLNDAGAMHITLGRVMDGKIPSETFNAIRRVISDHRGSKRPGDDEQHTVLPTFKIFDQAADHAAGVDNRYIAIDTLSRRTTSFLTMLPGNRGNDDENKGDRDLRGPEARFEESNPIIQDLIRNGRVVEISLENDKPTAHYVRWVEGYEPGKMEGQKAAVGEEVKLETLFPDKEVIRNIAAWLTDEAHQLPEVRGAVRFRIALDNSELGWSDDDDHAHVAHAGYHDGCIYMGERLFESIFKKADDPLRKQILDEDEFRHLTDASFNHAGEEEAYRERFTKAVARIKVVKTELAERYEKLGIKAEADDIRINIPDKQENSILCTRDARATLVQQQIWVPHLKHADKHNDRAGKQEKPHRPFPGSPIFQKFNAQNIKRDIMHDGEKSEHALMIVPETVVRVHSDKSGQAKADDIKK